MKIVISDAKTGLSYQRELAKEKQAQLVGKIVGEEIDGATVGLDGYALKITGGSDASGFPMHPAISGIRRLKALLSSAPGVRIKRKGERRKKTVLGNAVSQETMQLNTIIAKQGEKSLQDLGFVIQPKEKKAGEEEKKEGKKKKQ